MSLYNSVSLQQSFSGACFQQDVLMRFPKELCNPTVRLVGKSCGQLLTYRTSIIINECEILVEFSNMSLYLVMLIDKNISVLVLIKSHPLKGYL